MWEDEVNRKGGKWILRLKKGLAAQLWEDLLLAIVGDKLGLGEELCGAVLSIVRWSRALCVDAPMRSVMVLHCLLPSATPTM